MYHVWEGTSSEPPQQQNKVPFSTLFSDKQSLSNYVGYYPPISLSNTRNTRYFARAPVWDRRSPCTLRFDWI